MTQQQYSACEGNLFLAAVEKPPEDREAALPPILCANDADLIEEVKSTPIHSHSKGSRKNPPKKSDTS